MTDSEHPERKTPFNALQRQDLLVTPETQLRWAMTELPRANTRDLADTLPPVPGPSAAGRNDPTLLIPRTQLKRRRKALWVTGAVLLSSLGVLGSALMIQYRSRTPARDVSSLAPTFDSPQGLADERTPDIYPDLDRAQAPATGDATRPEPATDSASATASGEHEQQPPGQGAPPLAARSSQSIPQVRRLEPQPSPPATLTSRAAKEGLRGDSAPKAPASSPPKNDETSWINVKQ